jgi:hypothetical protein
MVAMFLDRTVVVRRAEMPDESAAGIRPGDRGMVGGNWCRQPLLAVLIGSRHISPVPLAGVVSGQFTHESGTEPSAAIRNRGERSQARGKFRPARRRSYPRGYGCYCADQHAAGHPGGTTPPKGHAPIGAWREKEVRRRGESGPGKVREPSSLGRSRQAGSPFCKRQRSLRGKRSDP